MDEAGVIATTDGPATKASLVRDLRVLGVAEADVVIAHVAAKVLLLGVDHGNDTSLHLAEHRATWPSKRTCTDGTALLIDGQRRWVAYDDLELDDSDFAAIGDSFATGTGAEQRGAVGLAIGRLCRQRAIVDAAVVHMTTHRR